VPDFGVQIETNERAVHVVLTGELDLAAVPSFEDELRRVEADQPAVLVVDLSGLSFIDSSGLRALVMADERARSRARRLALVSGPPNVQRVFELTQLDRRLDIVDDSAAV
jgi:anti-sigma B factor antagonist